MSVETALKRIAAGNRIFEDPRDAVYLCTATALVRTRQPDFDGITRAFGPARTEAELLKAGQIWCFLTAPWKLPPYPAQMRIVQAQFRGIADDRELQASFASLLRPAVAAGAFDSGTRATRLRVWDLMTMSRTMEA